ncbi:hypothetical protein [Corynebacterium sanguinis]|nr:hypothetical protein [Corynebacterium sanguinis]
MATTEDRVVDVLCLRRHPEVMLMNAHTQWFTASVFTDVSRGHVLA